MSLRRRLIGKRAVDCGMPVAQMVRSMQPSMCGAIEVHSWRIAVRLLLAILPGARIDGGQRRKRLLHVHAYAAGHREIDRRVHIERGAHPDFALAVECSAQTIANPRPRRDWGTVAADQQRTVGKSAFDIGDVARHDRADSQERLRPAK